MVYNFTMRVVATLDPCFAIKIYVADARSSPSNMDSFGFTLMDKMILPRRSVSNTSTNSFPGADT